MSFQIIITCANPDNLRVAVPLLCTHEPALEKRRIIVIADGDRAHEAASSLGCTVLPGTVPFVIARNLNTGINHAGIDDVFCINDDVGLKTIGGLSLLRTDALRVGVGLCSASFTGRAHPHQIKKIDLGGLKILPDPLRINFSCVFIPRSSIDQIGLLDEDFVGYGYDDDDYCMRIREIGLKIGVHHGCVVSHPAPGTSPTFDKCADFERMSQHNGALFQKKWGPGA